MLELASPASRLPFALEGRKVRPQNMDGFGVGGGVDLFGAPGELALPELEIGGLLDIALIVGLRRAVLRRLGLCRLGHRLRCRRVFRGPLRPPLAFMGRNADLGQILDLAIGLLLLVRGKLLQLLQEGVALGSEGVLAEMPCRLVNLVAVPEVTGLCDLDVERDNPMDGVPRNLRKGWCCAQAQKESKARSATSPGGVRGSRALHFVCEGLSPLR